MSTPTTVPSKVDRLAAHAEQAAALRAWQTHPDVIALRVERVRTQVDVLLWTGIVLGLAFTMVNVQQFAAEGAAPGSLAWCAAWLLDPMVSLVLLAILRAEQITSRYQVRLPAWAQRTKWLTFGATYLMNTWVSWGLADRPLSASAVVLHSVPPLVVFFTAETGPGLRDRLTEAVHRALSEAAARVGEQAVEQPSYPLHEPASGTAVEPVRERPARARRTPSRPSSRAGSRGGGQVRRRLLGEYIESARAQLTPGTDVTPLWCRQVTGCSAGTSVKVAAALRASHPRTTAPPVHQPTDDHPPAPIHEPTHQHDTSTATSEQEAA